MASRESAHSHPASFHQSVFLYRFQSVLRARRLVSACPGGPPRESLVKADEPNSELNSQSSHRETCVSASCIALVTATPRTAAPPTPTTKTRSNPVGVSSARRASRQRRRMVFRRALLPTALATTTAPLPFPSVQINRKNGPLSTRPFLKTLSKSSFVSSRRGLGSKAMTAFEPASLEHVAAVGCLHANPKAVRLLSVSIVGLVGALHFWGLRWV